MASATPCRRPSASRQADFDIAPRDRGADQGPHRYRRRRQLHRHLPRQRGRRGDRGADARTLSRHGGGRDRAPRRDAMSRWPLTGPHRDPSRRPHRAGRKHRAGADRLGAPPGGVRGGGIPDGLSEDQRAVLEARGKRPRAPAGSRRAATTTRPPRAGPNPDGQARANQRRSAAAHAAKLPQSRAPANC